MKKITLLASLLACNFLANAQQVTTFAGSDTGISTFDFPEGLAFDAAGNMYVADTYNNVIRKVTPAGAVSSVAGFMSGSADGTGTNAQFHTPYGIAIDVAGNIYVADTYNHRIRKVTSTGVVSTIAGSVAGSADGTGAAAQFNKPYALTTDAAGNIYVADTYNSRIRKITSAGVVSTLAGSTDGYLDGTGTAAQFYQPTGITIDTAGNLYVADRTNHRIRKITPTGVVSTFAGSDQGDVDGTGTAANFTLPQGIATDANGNMYLTDNNKIKKITPAGVVSTLAGSDQGYVDGTGTDAKFMIPFGVATDAAGNVYVADSDNNRIRKITLQALGLNDFQQSTAFSAYPNPFGDSLKIQSIAQSNYSYVLYDVTGKLLLSGNCDGVAEKSINTSALSRGIYVLALTSEGKTQHIKVVKG